MALTVMNCLSIEFDAWIEIDYDGLSVVPKDCFDPNDWEGKEITTEEKKGWCWRWYGSGKGYLTDNEWSVVYATKQEAFDAAFADLYATYDDVDDDKFQKALDEWDEAADAFEVSRKVVDVTRNS